CATSVTGPPWLTCAPTQDAGSSRSRCACRRPKGQTGGVMGVDLGLARPAVTSDKRFLGERRLRGHKQRVFRLRGLRPQPRPIPRRSRRPPPAQSGSATDRRTQPSCTLALLTLEDGKPCAEIMPLP